MNYTLTVTGTKEEMLALLDAGLAPQGIEPSPGPIEILGGPEAMELTVEEDPVVTQEEPETDSDGVVYDPEIHSSAKTKVKDGTWKKRRSAKKAPAPPANNTPEEVSVPSDFPALMGYLTGTLKLSLPEMNQLAKDCGVADGIMQVAILPEKVAEVFNHAKA